ncbi:MAG: IS30 family transposase, partial [Clostridia bacterium]|nr:IS30 family transposase [Clostridia bacterium]
MSSYKHFTLKERVCLQELLSEGKSLRKIADILGRNVSSVSREIKRNCSKYPKKKSNNRFKYHAWRANVCATVRRRQSPRRAIPKDSKIYEYVVECLNQFWSPEQIAERWKLEHPSSSLATSTIYRYVKNGEFEGITPKSHFRRRGKNYNYVHHNSNVIHPDHLIPDWPDAIVKRSRIGDWEGDTVYGGVGKGLIVTLVDRKSRFLCSGLLNSRDSEETRLAIKKLLTGLPVNSISLDNGSEFAKFSDIASDLNTTVFFAEPHKPWQRGTNENTNDILRFFFPKGFDFRSIDDSILQAVISSINN